LNLKTRTLRKIEPWTVSVEGPGGFLKVPDVLQGESGLEFVIPQSGRYSFSVGPNAILGNRGHVAICAISAVGATDESAERPSGGLGDDYLDMKHCFIGTARKLKAAASPSKLMNACNQLSMIWRGGCVRFGFAPIKCDGTIIRLATDVASNGTFPGGSHQHYW
jgi:hypothetical protein